MKSVLIICSFSLLCWASCKKAEKKSLEEVEKQEIARGVRNDSLFLGLAFGMTQQQFYSVCWDLNKKGILREGTGNTTAAYQLDKGELNYPAEMNFYPKFIDGKIYEMPVWFHYKGWAPWNEHLQSTKLILEVQKLMGKWYGDEGFFVSPLPGDAKKGIVKVDGNRKIIITLDGDKDVLVVISDLTVVK